MIIDRTKLDIAMANRAMSLTSVIAVTKISNNTMMKIRQEKHVRPNIAGRIALALNVPVINILKEDV